MVLKAGKFKSEYAGKMNFYLSAVDDLLRQPGDNSSIGFILCRSKVGVVAEYALRDMTKPIGFAEYRRQDALLENLQTLYPIKMKMRRIWGRDFVQYQVSKPSHSQSDVRLF